MGSSGSCLVSPLHRFLGCVFMRRQLQHIIKAEEFLTMIATGEPSVIAFR
jgi:mediator of RNA polymerase II transcription subunit 14